jgi:hypothetical protein
MPVGADRSAPGRGALGTDREWDSFVFSLGGVGPYNSYDAGGAQNVRGQAKHVSDPPDAFALSLGSDALGAPDLRPSG